MTPLAMFLMVLVTVACQPENSPQATPTEAAHSKTASPSATRLREGTVRERNKPPPVIVTGDTTVELSAWTYCYGDLCVDGAPPADPPDVGDPHEVVVTFPLSRWRFDASFRPAGEECGRTQQVALDEPSDGHYILRPAGFAGTYDVTLFGRGDGDLFTTFRWTTPIDGPLPEPKARLAIVAGDPGEETSYGVELDVSNLESTPEKARAIITVSAAGGESISFRATLARGRCFSEGSLYFDGPDDKGRAAVELGSRPYTYEVELILDGVHHTATATWPADQIPGNHPSVRLDFSPPLPRLSH